MSKRFGRPKQLLRVKGHCLIEQVLDASLDSRLDCVVLVLGYRSEDILHALGERVNTPRLQVVINHRYREGQSRSLCLGLAQVKETYPSVMFLLGDQPMVNSAAIDYLLERFWNSEKDMCVPVCGGKRGNPTIFSRDFYDTIMNIKGDVGARTLIETYPERVLYTPIDNRNLFLDIDTEADLRTWESLLSRKIHKKFKPIL